MKFAEASALDLNKLHTEWYDWTMKGGAKPAFLKKRVAYYVMGAEEWKYADDLETLANDKLTLYLASNNAAADVFHSGMLRVVNPGSMAADSWTYDPLHTEAGEADQADDAASFISQRSAFNLFGEGAIYHSEGFSGSDGDQRICEVDLVADDGCAGYRFGRGIVGTASGWERSVSKQHHHEGALPGFVANGKTGDAGKAGEVCVR